MGRYRQSRTFAELVTSDGDNWWCPTFGGMVSGESGVGIRHRNGFLVAMVKWGVVPLVCILALVTSWPSIAHTGCANILATVNVNSKALTDKHSIPDWWDYCFTSSQTSKTMSIPLIRQLGVYLQKRDDVDAAITIWRRAIDQGSADPFFFVYLGLAEIQVDQLESAALTLSRVVDADQLLDNRGNQKLKQEAYEEALASYQVATQIAPNSAIAWRGLGRAYEGQGDMHAAVIAYEAALVRSPDDHEAHYELGMLLWELKDTGVAVRHLKRAVDLTPEKRSIGRRNILALVRAQRGADLHADALRTAQTAVSRFSQSPYVHFELGETLRLLGDPSAALAAYNQAIQLRPNNAQFYFVSGLAHLQLSNLQAALLMFAEAVSLKPQNKWYLYHYGRTFDELAQHCEAANYYRRALFVDPDYELPQKGLENLETQGLLANCGD